MKPTTRVSHSFIRNWRSVAFVLVLIVGLTPSIVDAQQRDWAWFSAMTASDGWFIVRGKATVTFSGESFSAQLYDDGGDLRFTVNGKVTNDKVDATAVRQSSDEPPQRLTGSRQRVGRADGPGGRDAILMTQPNRPVGLVIGLSREFE